MMSLFIGGFIGQLLGGALNDRLHRYKLSLIISLCGSTTAIGLFFYISTLGNLAADIVIAAVIGLLMKGKDFIHFKVSRIQSIFMGLGA